MFEIGSDQGEDVKNLDGTGRIYGRKREKGFGQVLDRVSLACMIGRMSNRKDEEKDV